MAGPGAPIVIAGILLRKLLKDLAKPKPKQKNCKAGNCKKDPPPEWHHEYPQAFWHRFKGVQIDIDAIENGRMIPKAAHTAIHRGGYNPIWGAFLATSPSIRRGQMVDFRDEMVQRFFLNTFPRPTRRYYPKKKRP